MRTKIKVCGVTRLDQALLMESMGVDFLGFNFVETSSRVIRPELASEIIQELGTKIINVGIFQNTPPKRIRHIIGEAGLDALQFHGTEKPEVLAQFDLPCIKVFSVGDDFDPKVTDTYANVADYFLFDTQKGNLSGGTGDTFDWSLVQNYPFTKPWFLAGGMGPMNVASAIAELAPFGVDLNSKIEVEPGNKDLELLEQCLKRISKTEKIMADDADQNEIVN